MTPAHRSPDDVLLLAPPVLLATPVLLPGPDDGPQAA